MVLEIRHLYKSFHQRQLINDLSILFPRYGMIGIVGKSGCGKSTLLNLIAGLDKDYQGEIYIDQQNIDDLKGSWKKDYLSFLYQNYRLLEYGDVYHNCLLYCHLKGIKVSSSYLRYLLDIFELTAIKHQKVHQLSGGQKQRVAMIRSLLSQTPIILCDEPTGSLNDENKHKVFQVLKQFSQQHLIIVVSHDRTILSQYTKHIIDFDHIQHVYSFPQEKYATYTIENGRIHSMRYEIFSFLLSQKKKIIMMILSQVFMICASTLMITGVTGMKSYYQHQYQKTLNNNLVQIVRNDHLAFTVDELKALDANLGYSFELGQIEGMNELFQSSYYPQELKQGEVVINQAMHKLIQKQSIHYIIGQNSYDFQVVKVINDNDSYPTLYYSKQSIYQELKAIIEDFYNCFHYQKNYQTVDDYISSLHQDYQGICFVQEDYQGYQQMMTLCQNVSYVFIIISILISIILIVFILLSLFYQQRQSLAVYLANGMSQQELRVFLFKEVFIIMMINALLSEAIMILTLFVASFFDISQSLFSISKLFQLPVYFYNRYDLFLIVMVMYMMMACGVYLCIYLDIKRVRLIELLKEE